MSARLRCTLLATSLLVSSALASPAWAQTDSAPGTAADATSPAPGIQAPENSPVAESSTGEIVVTGTLIRDPNAVASAPVQVVGRDEIRLRQSNTAEEILRTLPGAVPSVGSAVNNGGAGSFYADLRGLGNFRNVVLLDGNRIAPADLLGRVDLNNIPLALVERVDTLTGGASTTYGADAITGVVNFITRSNFTGAEIAASKQITERGDGAYFRGDVTLGSDFADGKGNAVLSFGYQKSDPVYQGARGFSATQIDSYTGRPGGSSTSLPSSFSVGALGTQQLNVATGALVTPYQPFNYNPYNVFQTPFKRYNVYSAAHYEVADDVELYGRGMYSKNTVSTIVAPSGVFGALVTLPLSNPYLPAAARASFCANNDFNPNLAGIQTLTPAQCAAGAVATSPNDPNYRTFTTQLRIRTTDVGPRIDVYETQLFDIRGGVRGKISSDISFDVSGSYGESENFHGQDNYVSLTRVRDALLATNPNNCLSGTAGCVPLNIFGNAGAITEAQAAGLRVPATSRITSSLTQVRGQINGSVGLSSPLAERPVSFAIGGEYRKYKAAQEADALARNPSELGGGGGAITPFTGGYDVIEGFGEIIAPLVQNQPFIQELSLEAGIRQSHYSIKAPGSPSFNTTTWKAGGSWQPVDAIKFRGVYQRAIRAPNISELFQPSSTGLGSLNIDPCAGRAPTTNAALRAVCLAQGAPAFAIGVIQNPAAGQPNQTTGGNLALKPEKATTYTLGAVIRPSFVPSLTVTIDYYNIKIEDAITIPTPQDAINACFGAISAASATDPACTGIRRNPITGALDGDAGTTGGVLLGRSNAGRLSTDGIDLGVNWRHDFGPALLNLSFQGNWTNSSKFRATPISVNRECVGFYSANCGYSGSIQPEFSWNQRTTVTVGPADVSLLWRHVDAVRQEPLDVLANGPAFGTFGRIKSYDIFDSSIRFRAAEQLELTITVTNLFDKQPPIVGGSIGNVLFGSGNTYPSTYDALGRRFAFGGRLTF
ncbi:TonB-dependent receptor plug domain-containing protein [Sphingomonas jatrophae]|uniref:TonB-dependent Receptor Plug Domain n=1 Tax=Sphingomonas jatrophae TaxID=1166337 RepID=A0A1I6KBA3_9SPHN|nr:TonB-dependent receptor [Sphingomonas jatrophae]SFR88308.1 TonB-dependent Receptor Plug Domain [Sphingomonas jatrophae]